MFLEYRLKKIRIKNQKKLSEGNLFLYRDITKYINNSGLREFEKEEALQQIMDMMLEAEANNRPIDMVIGKNYEEFCNSIIEEYTSRNQLLYKILKHFENYLIGLLLLLLMFLIINILKHHSGALSLDEILFANIWALLFSPYMRKDQRGSIINYYKKRNLPIYFFQGRYTLEPGFIYSFFLSIAGYFGIEFVLKKLYGNSIMNYNVSFLNNAKYIISIIVIIGAIEVYQRFAKTE